MTIAKARHLLASSGLELVNMSTRYLPVSRDPLARCGRGSHVATPSFYSESRPGSRLQHRTPTSHESLHCHDNLSALDG